ncbi:hypothetical protein RAC89_28550 [Paenibacillus sp. GD4]|uniref:hypothetical protein n=1 Tax=Paenibacillus sp. GD4 TaxID=3068890 RepID=UPI0027964797|nr:hypothetical protein [Paenibacillus sp. GD4]MDQ1914333.1 hypothetical protein [Paenibacillus sp. GD4]
MVEIIEKEQFVVTGKLGKGFAKAPQWIPSLNLVIHHHVKASACFFKEQMCT